MDGLTGYQRRRLELADMVRAVLPVAHAYGDEQRERQIRGLLARLAAGRFKLAVIGQFSRGKTTLMNALLGAAYLPMGALPMTSVVTTVRYGAEARALVRRHAAALPVEVPVAEVASFVAQGSAERTRMRVASVELEIPAELLRLGFEFIDTPGVGSAIAANTAATLRFLPQADAIVFVTGFDSALTSAEASFLSSAAEQAAKLFLVINKRDLVTSADAAQVIAFVQRWARGSLPAEPPVFGISALSALDGAVNNNVSQLAGSGIGPLRAALTRFLTAEQGRVALGNVAGAMASLVARQERDLRAGQLTCSGPSLDSVAADFQAQVSRLRDQLATLADRIAATAGTAVAGALAERGPGWEAELTEQLAPAAMTSEEAGSPPDSDPVAGVLEKLRRAGRQAASDWAESRAAELSEVLVDAAAGDIGVLFDLARSPRELGAAITGLPVFDNAPAGWTADEIPQLGVPTMEWTVPGPPARHRPRRDRGKAADETSHVIKAAVSAAVTDFAGRANAAFTSAAAHWARRLGEQALQQASAEAAQFRRYLDAQPRQDDLAVLADLAGRLAGFRDALAAWVPDASQPEADLDAASHAAPSDSGGICTICGQMERKQIEYLIRRQFQLATSEADQASHAETGGFCPLHTWLYVNLGSPVGISAGNARLANQVAGALREADANSGDASELAKRVADLAAGAQVCPVCVVLARKEREAAEGLAAQVPLASQPRLCLRHLALVLSFRPSLAVGRDMTGMLALALQRASENMRAYALKREALRRGIITADEATAYTDALRLLAGHSALALPARPE